MNRPESAKRLTLPDDVPTRPKGDYDSPIYRANRKIVLGRNPLCELRFAGCTGWAREAHHRNKDATDHRLENLGAVCRRCHLKLHKTFGY